LVSFYYYHFEKLCNSYFTDHNKDKSDKINIDKNEGILTSNVPGKAIAEEDELFL